MNALLLGALARILTDRWAGASVQKGWVDTRGRLVLRLRRRGQSGFLLIGPTPSGGCFGIIPKRPGSLPRPPALAAYVRANIGGGRFAGAETLEWERVVRFTFDVAGERFSLVLECFGSNAGSVTALDPDEVCRASTSWDPPWGRLRPGACYRPPPRPERLTMPEAFDPKRLAALVNAGIPPRKQIFGLDPEAERFLLGLCPSLGPGPALAELVRIYRETTTVFPTTQGNVTVFPEADGTEGVMGDEALVLAGRMMEEGHDQPDVVPSQVERDRVERRWRKKLERRLAWIDEELAVNSREEEAKRTADLLAANLHRVRQGMGSLEADDAEGTVSIPLDPGLTPGENLDLAYRRVKKELKRVETNLARRTETLAELEAGPPDGLFIASPPVKPDRGGKDAVKHPFRTYRSSDGFNIWVGRNAVENDRIVREARPWDVWIHAKEVTGAHVVVRMKGREGKMPDRTLAEAAGLVLANSGYEPGAKGLVMVAPVSRVRKVKGGGPGKVTVTGERVVHSVAGAGKPGRV